MTRWMPILGVLAVGGAWCAVARADALADDRVKERVEAVVPLKARAFSLEDVRLLDGPFRHAQEMDARYLLSLDVDRLLHDFRLNAAIPSTARPLGGWEAPDCELRGHFVGHYLSACSMMYASTGDARFKDRTTAIVKGLAEVQAKLGASGYLSAYPESFIDRVEARQQVWAPYYTLHKIFAGLMDTYVYCDNQQALEVCRKMGDWAVARNSKLTDAQMQGMLENEQGGMNEALANLYALTGDRKYLAMSGRFNHQRIVGSFARQVDNLDGQHANTQIPKFVGAAREYELTSDQGMKTAATFFWNSVVHERSYVIGGNSDGEAFSPKARLSTAFGPSTTETCNTYNMLKLTRHLFTWDPMPAYADYYERALFNHILGSQNPEDGMMTYYMPLRSGSAKDFRGPESFVCCAGTGIENHAKYGDSIFFHDGAKTLYVNQFIASELTWLAEGLSIRQETRYPDEPSTRLRISTAKPTSLSVKLRRPAWATAGYEIRVNGQPVPAGSAGSFVDITRTWNSGDVVDVAMPFNLHTEGFKDNPRRIAVLNGPVVLAAAVTTANGPFPNIIADTAKFLAALRPVEGKPNTFESSGDVLRVPGRSTPVSITMEPLYKVYNHRYMVYFDQLTAEQFAAQEARAQAAASAEAALASRTVDAVFPRQEQLERDHNVLSERSNTGDFNDKSWRDAPGGWFSWDLKVTPSQAQEMVVTYWGSDTNRTFDVLIDGQKIATQVLQNQHPNEFFDVVYPITAAMVRDKQKITVRFQAQDNSTAGGVFGVRIVRSARAP